MLCLLLSCISLLHSATATGILSHVFVTSTLFPTGNLGGLTGARRSCQAAADAVSSLQNRTWMPWLSASTDNPVDSPNFVISGLMLRIPSNPFPLVLIDGTVVAPNMIHPTAISPGSPNDGLWSGNFLLHAINMNEHGVTISTSLITWTGTDENGYPMAATCLDWTSASNSDVAMTGIPTAVNPTWTRRGTQVGCLFVSNFPRLYCVSVLPPCMSAPCQNGGSCYFEETGTNLTCVCASGYTGTFCQTMIDYCASMPCRNGATCTAGLNSFVCSCATGFLGTTCQTVDGCASSPCQNGGTCATTPGTGAYTCTCQSFTYGLTCGNVTSCSPSLCANGGTCLVHDNGFACACMRGYDGNTCQIDARQCIAPAQSCSASSICTAHASSVADIQIGSRFNGTGAVGVTSQSTSTAISADSLTFVTGGPSDNSSAGAVWVYVYNTTTATWNQDGPKLVGTGAVNPSQQGSGVAIDATGVTIVSGAPQDNSYAGACYVFSKSNGAWTQQGAKLVGSGAIATPSMGNSVAISAGGKTIACGGYLDNSGIGAVWIFVLSGGVWTQQGSKLVGSGYNANPYVFQGGSVALSYTGDTLVVGAYNDENSGGSIWLWRRSSSIWSQMGSKLTAIGSVQGRLFGSCVSISADGHTVVAGAPLDSSDNGAVYVFESADLVTWTQLSPALFGVASSGPGLTHQGGSVSISGDGSTIASGCLNQFNGIGGTFQFTRTSRSTWTQALATPVAGRPTVYPDAQGQSVSLPATASRMIEGDPTNGWAFAFNRDAHQCTCIPGYSGVNCAININECASTPCTNGTVCADGINSFVCVGSPCLSSPCTNGGTCTSNAIGLFTCACTATTTGATCSQCSPGYSGSTCLVNINECASSPCRNGGTCSDGINSFSCVCPIGFHGTLCLLLDSASILTQLSACDCGVTWIQLATATADVSLVSGANVFIYGLVDYIPVTDVLQAKYLCYANIQCRAVYYYQPLGSLPVAYLVAYPVSVLPTPLPSNHPIPSTLDFNRATLYVALRYENYDCPSFVLDAYYYYFLDPTSARQQSIEALYCPYTSTATGACCWTAFTNGGLTCANPLGTIPGSSTARADITSQLWVQSAILHWTTYGNKQRVNPNSMCMLTPTAWNPATACQSEQIGCTANQGLPCSGNGICRTNAFPTASSLYNPTDYPHYCDCNHFPSNVLGGVAQYMGSACQSSVLQFCTGPNDPLELCGGNTERCIPSLLIGSSPSDYRPACDCESAPPLSTTGTFCETSRCGVSKCQPHNVADGMCVQDPTSLIWSCSCATGGGGGASTTGPDCGQSGAACQRTPGATNCEGRGICYPSGLNPVLYPKSAYPNYNDTHAFCACTTNLAFGTYCENSFCNPALVTPGRGTCDINGNLLSCFKPYQSSGLSGHLACDIDICAQYGGIAVHNPPDDCSCLQFAHGTGTDITCHPRCPSANGIVCGATTNQCVETQFPAHTGVRYAKCVCDTSAYISAPASIAAPNDPTSWSVPPGQTNEICTPFCIHGTPNGFVGTCTGPAASCVFGVCSCVCDTTHALCTSTNICLCPDTGFDTALGHPRCDHSLCQNGAAWQTTTLPHGCACIGPYTIASNCVIDTCHSGGVFVEGAPAPNTQTPGVNMCLCNPPYANPIGNVFACTANVCGSFGSVSTSLTTNTPADQLCTCTPGSAKQTVCYDGTGHNCDFCTVSICQNGGFIVTNNIAHTAQCQCLFPYNGTTCAGNVCGLYGSPITSACSCNNGWTGLSCGVSPCQHGSIWNATLAVCACSSTYTGIYCETLITSSSTAGPPRVVSSSSSTAAAFMSGISSTGRLVVSSSSTGTLAASSSGSFSSTASATIVIPLISTAAASPALSSGAIAGIAGGSIAVAVGVLVLYWNNALCFAAKAASTAAVAGVDRSRAGAELQGYSRRAPRHTPTSLSSYRPVADLYADPSAIDEL